MSTTTVAQEQMMYDTDSRRTIMTLRELVFLPNRETGRKNYLDYISAHLPHGEHWGEDLRILETYVHSNFELAREQGLLREADDGSSLVFRVGDLSSIVNEPISIVCERNSRIGKQPYRFKGVVAKRRITVDVDGHEALVMDAPPAPTYEKILYHRSYRLDLSHVGHFVSENRSRVDEALAERTERERLCSIVGGLELAHARGDEIAIAQWYRDRNANTGSYQWLLPLHIVNDDLSGRPEWLATLEPRDGANEYYVRTLLPVEMAYPHARVVGTHRPMLAWLRRS
jgi:hypothetical protein